MHSKDGKDAMACESQRFGQPDCPAPQGRVSLIVQTCGLQGFEQHCTEFGRVLRTGNACGLKGGEFLLSRPFATGDDGASVAHTLTWRCSRSRNESNDGLGDVVSSPCGSFLFGIAADFDHHDGFGLRVCLKGSQAFDEAGAVDRVATDTDAGGLTFVDAHRLGDGFVSECRIWKRYQCGPWHEYGRA